jgi:PAS domain S-box-containing protein
MAPKLSLSQLTLVAGGTLLVGGLLVFIVYIIHKMIKDRREEADLAPHSPRADDEPAFAMAALQGVISRMKEQEKELIELRQAAEKRARESARLSENIIREMPGGLMVFNREGFITASNPAVRALLGVDTWARRRYSEILGAQSRLSEHICQCLETGRPLSQESVQSTLPSGEKRVLGVSVSPFHDANGGIAGVVCLLTDMTELRQLQDQVRLKEHLAALGTMSAGIAHELKNALTSISGYAQLLRDADLVSENRGFAEKIVQEVRSLSQVVTDFLALSKPMQVTAQQLNLEELIRQAFEDLRRVESFAHVNFRLEGTFAAIEGDEVLLRQAFSNLLRNACEALKGEETPGQITVRGELQRQAERDFLKVQVSDSGRGVPSDDREKVFLPFYTTKPEGSGLGLALVQKIIVSHNGSVVLEAGTDGGATFSVLLPLRQEAAAVGERTTASAAN